MINGNGENFAGTGSIEDLLNIDTRRENFHFPKDFSFQNPKFSKEVFELYGRNNFDWKKERRQHNKKLREKYYFSLLNYLPKGIAKTASTAGAWITPVPNEIYENEKIGREEKRKARKSYHKKCEEYFIEQHHWPKGLARATSTIVGLPNHANPRKVPKKALDFTINAVAGSLPEKYASPIAKLMNEETSILTKDSIIFDACEILFVGAAAAGLWTGSDLPFIENSYDWLGLREETVKWWMTGAAAFRTAEVAVRTALYKYNNKMHTPSPAIIFPFNPSLSRGGLMLLIAGYDAAERMKDIYLSAKNKINEYSPNKIEMTKKEKYDSIVSEYAKDFSDTARHAKTTHLPSSDA